MFRRLLPLRCRFSTSTALSAAPTLYWNGTTSVSLLSWGRGASGQLGGGKEERRLYPSPVVHLFLPDPSPLLSPTPRTPPCRCGDIWRGGGDLLRALPLRAPRRRRCLGVWQGRRRSPRPRRRVLRLRPVSQPQPQRTPRPRARRHPLRRADRLRRRLLLVNFTLGAAMKVMVGCGLEVGVVQVKLALSVFLPR